MILKHLKKFDTDNLYQDFKSGEDFIRPNVTYVINDNIVHYDDMLITYYINDIEYTCERGTTWRDIATDFEQIINTESYGYYVYYANDANLNFNVYDSHTDGDFPMIDSKFNYVLIDNKIKNGERIYSKGNETFSIDGEEYKIINGMTWKQFVDWKCIYSPFDCDMCFVHNSEEDKIYSTYNEAFVNGGWCIGGGITNYAYLKYQDDTYVRGNDIIRIGYNYPVEITNNTMD